MFWLLLHIVILKCYNNIEENYNIGKTIVLLLITDQIKIKDSIFLIYIHCTVVLAIVIISLI